MYSLASKIPPLQPVTHTYSSSNSVPCSDGYTLRWMSCTKLYRDERWGRPPHANTEEAMHVCWVCACVCVRACVHVLMSQSEHWVLPLGHHSSLTLAVSASETFQPNVRHTTTTTHLYLCFHCIYAYVYGCVLQFKCAYLMLHSRSSVILASRRAWE